MVELRQNGENKNPTAFRVATQRGIASALGTLSQRFEQSESAENNLAFHNAEHTRGVMQRTDIILRSIQSSPEGAGLVSERDILLAGLISSYHDVVQDWELKVVEEDGKEPKKMRQRFVGQNEQKSADELISFMRQTNDREGALIFTDDDQLVAQEAILSTIPGFNPEVGTVIQPRRPESPSVIALAVSLADLATAGMDGGEAFVHDGSTLFVEENLDIAENLRSSKPLSEKQKREIAARILGWSKFQPVFARGRQALLDSELSSLSETVQEALKEKVFTKFEESIEASGKKAEERTSMSFDQLVRDVGYRVNAV